MKVINLENELSKFKKDFKKKSENLSKRPRSQLNRLGMGSNRDLRTLKSSTKGSGQSILFSSSVKKRRPGEEWSIGRRSETLAKPSTTGNTSDILSRARRRLKKAKSIQNADKENIMGLLGKRMPLESPKFILNAKKKQKIGVIDQTRNFSTNGRGKNY